MPGADRGRNPGAPARVARRIGWISGRLPVCRVPRYPASIAPRTQLRRAPPPTIVSAASDIATFIPDVWAIAWCGVEAADRRADAAKLGIASERVDPIVARVTALIADERRYRLAERLLLARRGGGDGAAGRPRDGAGSSCSSSASRADHVPALLEASAPPPSLPGNAAYGEPGVRVALRRGVPVLASGHPLGFEPLCFDRGLGCSWLCNGLEVAVARELGIRPNAAGLLEPTPAEARARGRLHFPGRRRRGTRALAAVAPHRAQRSLRNAHAGTSSRARRPAARRSALCRSRRAGGRPARATSMVDLTHALNAQTIFWPTSESGVRAPAARVRSDTGRVLLRRQRVRHARARGHPPRRADPFRRGRRHRGPDPARAAGAARRRHRRERPRRPRTRTTGSPPTTSAHSSSGTARIPAGARGAAPNRLGPTLARPEGVSGGRHAGRRISPPLSRASASRRRSS